MSPSIEDDDNVHPFSAPRREDADIEPEVLLDELEPGEFARRVTGSREEMGRFITDTALKNVLRAARPWGNLTLEQSVALARAAVEREHASKVVSLPAGTDESSRLPRYRGWLPWASAAAIAAIVAGLLLMSGPTEQGLDTSRHYAAPANAPKTVTLTDGTRVTLAAATTLDEEFTAQQRNVHLPAGEAEFTVAHDEGRPFFVHTPFGGVVRAVGTRFRVSIRDQQVNVSVSEGKVQLSRSGSGDAGLALAAGQTAILHLTGGIEAGGAASVAAAQPPSVPARRNPISFTRERLGKVALIFNERSGRHAFEVRGSACEFVISSVLDPARPEELVRDIHDEPGLEVREEGDVNVIRARGDGSDAPCREKDR